MICNFKTHKKYSISGRVLIPAGSRRWVPARTNPFPVTGQVYFSVLRTDGSLYGKCRIKTKNPIQSYFIFAYILNFG